LLSPIDAIWALQLKLKLFVLFLPETQGNHQPELQQAHPQQADP
jgi:hypothetical protein